MLRQVGQAYGHIYQLLCLRAWNQHGGIDHEGVAVEDGAAYHVLYGFIAEQPVYGLLNQLSLLHAEGRGYASHYVREGQVQ